MERSEYVIFPSCILFFAFMFLTFSFIFFENMRKTIEIVIKIIPKNMVLVIVPPQKIKVIMR